MNEQLLVINASIIIKSMVKILQFNNFGNWFLMLLSNQPFLSNFMPFRLGFKHFIVI